MFTILSPGIWTIFSAVLGATVIYHIAQFFRVKKQVQGFPLPPGPKPLPLLGNVFDLSQGKEGLHWAKHKAVYGPISSLKVFGTTFIIINDHKTAYELMEKRSGISASRPVPTFAGKMVGYGGIVTLVPYNDNFKIQRTLMHSYIGTHAALRRFERGIEVETHRTLLNILNDPDRFADHLETASNAIILKITHGYNVDPHDPDYLVELAYRGVDVWSKSITGGTWTTDVLPQLQYLPAWLPGMKFKRIAHKWRTIARDFAGKPFDFVKHQMSAGKAHPSFTFQYIEEGYDDEVVKWAAAGLYLGGAATAHSALLRFFLAMALSPSILKRAQEEVDQVIGSSRLPTSADRPNLPYINALTTETLRWHSLVPVAPPHLVTEDSTYMGYQIPKNSVILGNIWQMAHDPDVYPDPFLFKPERYLGENDQAIEPDPRNVIFGFGRRVCPGRELAETSLFIAIAMNVAVFDISKSKDNYGHEIEPTCDFLPGMISHPRPFTCSIGPRSEKAIALIQSIRDEHPFEKGDSALIHEL